jgi:hypothetical protein
MMDTRYIIEQIIGVIGSVIILASFVAIIKMFGERDR